MDAWSAGPAGRLQIRRQGLRVAYPHQVSRWRGERRQVVDFHPLHAVEILPAYRLGGAAMPDLHGQSAAGIAQHFEGYDTARPVSAAAEHHDARALARARRRQIRPGQGEEGVSVPPDLARIVRPTPRDRIGFRFGNGIEQAGHELARRMAECSAEPAGRFGFAPMPAVKGTHLRNVGAPVTDTAGGRTGRMVRQARSGHGFTPGR